MLVRRLKHICRLRLYMSRYVVCTLYSATPTFKHYLYMSRDVFKVCTVLLRCLKHICECLGIYTVQWYSSFKHYLYMSRDVQCSVCSATPTFQTYLKMSRDVHCIVYSATPTFKTYLYMSRDVKWYSYV